MLDHDLAALDEVETKALVQAVKRSRDRFPPDFLVQLSADELADGEVTDCDLFCSPKTRSRAGSVRWSGAAAR